ncbi:hypothetical protein [Pseudanabaena yagii]|uniref:Uncharacterized protein n=1 Tax=Pseudanabaena yagii GIHE-NHR1 TaxID=2722753 RepID=A0ABX1LMK1_9CYAN|nr:hypothetical protein [Pseudanabaena yagii]NMF57333.1 hypothetical protein [Pseudanabaena yagii GIHE-NHR1]
MTNESKKSYQKADRITLPQDIQAKDLPFLPEELRDNFIQYQRLLKLDP